VLAYCNGGAERTLLAVHLGRTGGNYLWTEVGDFDSNSIPTPIEDSVVMFGGGSGTAVDRATGAQNVFFVDSAANLNGGAPAVYNSQRKDFYVKLDYSVQGESKVLAFHYNSQDSIKPHADDTLQPVWGDGGDRPGGQSLFRRQQRTRDH
jgi:hypothetical protein